MRLRNRLSRLLALVPVLLLFLCVRNVLLTTHQLSKSQQTSSKEPAKWQQEWRSSSESERASAAASSQSESRTALEPSSLSTITTTEPNKTHQCTQSDLVIDIISIGSHVRPNYQDVQRETFGSHATVRHFFRITESNDTDKSCLFNLTESTLHRIIHHCKWRRADSFPLLSKLKRLFADKNYLSQKASAVGWMCAQKRPLDGMYQVFQFYQQNHQVLPDYLWVLDDDTYVNMPLVLSFLTQHYPPHEAAFAIAGCMLRLREKTDFTLAFGGWGTFFSKPALERWLQTIHCPSSNETTVQPLFNETAALEESPAPDDGHHFVQHVCHRVLQNLLGEGSLFRNGMSVFDLLHRYSTTHRYADFDHWDEAGYCVHSDTALAYFINYYDIAVHAHHVKYRHLRHDRLRGYMDSLRYVGIQQRGAKYHRKQCNFRNDTHCTMESHLCHYVTPGRMQELFRLQPP